MLCTVLNNSFRFSMETSTTMSLGPFPKLNKLWWMSSPACSRNLPSYWICDRKTDGFFDLQSKSTTGWWWWWTRRAVVHHRPLGLSFSKTVPTVSKVWTTAYNKAPKLSPLILPTVEVKARKYRLKEMVCSFGRSHINNKWNHGTLLFTGDGDQSAFSNQIFYFIFLCVSPKKALTA